MPGLPKQPYKLTIDECRRLASIEWLVFEAERRRNDGYTSSEVIDKYISELHAEEKAIFREAIDRKARVKNLSSGDKPLAPRKPAGSRAKGNTPKGDKPKGKGLGKK
jgi:hypothetical protein